MLRSFGFWGQMHESAPSTVEYVRNVTSSRQNLNFNTYPYNNCLCDLSGLMHYFFFVQCVSMKNFSCICGTFKWAARFRKTSNILLDLMLVEVLQWLWVRWERSRERTQDTLSAECILFAENMLLFQLLSYNLFCFVWLIFFLHHWVKELSNRKEAKCPKNHEECTTTVHLVHYRMG